METGNRFFSTLALAGSLLCVAAQATPTLAQDQNAPAQNQSALKREANQNNAQARHDKSKSQGVKKSGQSR